MPRTVAWIKSKAASYSAGWTATFNGAVPTNRNIALGLAVAIHETNAGDAWPGENNIGAVQLRVLNKDELAVIKAAGLVPHPKNVDAARIALENAVARGEIHAEDDGALHVDSSPDTPTKKGGWYWVFFRAFATEAEGFAFFVKVLAKNRPGCKVVLEDPNGTSYQLAGGMYRSRYFEGFRKPASWYAKINHFDGKGPTWTVVDAGTEGAVLGSDLNIADYGGACHRIYLEVQAALTTVPVVVPTPTTKRRTIRRGDQDLRLIGSDVRDLQVAIGAEPDGRFGPKTEDLLKTFQLAHGLTPDGIAGKNTWAVIDAAA